ncbi:hypothetical protein EW146_g8844 [Bondarzewia mesenterica]|uniref:Phytanoyl-CoA dioxygenase n=1 Tax=Bondarzewia mesenterica TaxID=1095465 RepID=A0A4S4LB97_9AGAM|nr:hypothetical protein EW146_g8844 [Bondarzewia mesenterica]
MDRCLTPEQREQFLAHGWIRIEGGVPKENIERFLENVWVRLGYDPDEKSTWLKEKIHMPRHREIATPEFMPKAWGAICELLGGEQRIDRTLFESCGDSLIVNLGSKEWESVSVPYCGLIGTRLTSRGDEFGTARDPAQGLRKLAYVNLSKHLDDMKMLIAVDGSDGDWFTHFLDSGEQALEILILYNDILPRAGATWIAPDGIKNTVRFLYDHPEGTSEFSQDPDGSRSICSIQTCNDFVELTGKAGDVILMHPFMPHSASKNHLRIPRFITNPSVTLKAPFNLNRENPADYSLVEQKILNTLGVTSLPSWKITGERRRFTPRTRAGKDALIVEEVERLKAHAMKTGGTVESMHLNGPVQYQVIVG